MLDHIGLAISNLDRSRRFYDAALAPLGLSVQTTMSASETLSGGRVAGYGQNGNAFFWIGDNERVGEGTHVAFVAATRAQVDAFHDAAIAAGGRDNGGPGIREHYHPDYYAAFVFDPDGINVEAVCHAPE